MIACAADVVVLGKHSFLGPIDPQIIVNTPLGQRMVPAQAILEQFEQAIKECQDPKKLGAWLPMLNQYGPDLLVLCERANELSRELVQGWLETYMFKSDPKKADKAKSVAEWLANHGNFKSHGRHISRNELEGHRLKIEHLETDQTAQDLFLSVIHATTHTFNGTSAVKIIENHPGKAFIKQAAPVVIQVPTGMGDPGLTPDVPLPGKMKVI